MTEQFEQAKREFAEKYNPLFSSRLDEVREKTKSEFLSDLTALLEQHKEMILKDMYPKAFLLWSHDNVQVESAEETFLVYNEVRFYTTDEVFDFWERVKEKNKWIKRQRKLKNVKKSPTPTCAYRESTGGCIPGCGTDSCMYHPNNR